MKRRTFLQASAAAGVALAAPVMTARAVPEPYEGTIFAVFNASGGWDTTYLMDPKGGDLNRQYGDGDIRLAGSIPYAPTEGHIAPGAMTNRAFFERYASELLVVNGVDTSVNNHAPCSRYVGTGKLESTAYPNFPSLVAACSAPEVPLAYVHLGGYGGTGNLVPANRIPYRNTLAGLIHSDETNTGPLHHAETFRLLDETLLEVALEDGALPRVQRARSVLHASQINSTALKRAAPYLESAPSPEEKLEQEIEVALAGFASGLTVAAQFRVSAFDTHGQNDPGQMEQIPKLLSGVDYFMRRAEEMSLRERVVVIMQSELGRTPWYNGNDGKDHWSITSMMAMGRGVRGNRVIGGTRINTESGREQSPVLVNPVTLEADQTGIRIRPQHIHQAQRELAGIETHAFSERFPFRIPAEERLTNLFA